jgi:hypothetical protein
MKSIVVSGRCGAGHDPRLRQLAVAGPGRYRPSRTGSCKTVLGAELRGEAQPLLLPTVAGAHGCLRFRFRESHVVSRSRTCEIARGTRAKERFGWIQPGPDA